MRGILVWCLVAGSQLVSRAAAEQPRFVEMPADVLEDKVRGGLLGQILGNLNGLPHEMKYIHEPGQVARYTPSLPKGAWTDDDTDIEWVYVSEMQRSGQIFIPPKRIAELWRTHINRGIWCANLYARNLMDLGIEPPLTGRIAINPWSVFNISGQFISESFGLMSPGMPQTAGKIGLHYTHVSIDGEPAQTTQLFTAMIATAYMEPDVEKIVQAGLRAVDPKSQIHAVVSDVHRWWQENPKDWRVSRRRIKEKYQRHGGEMRDRNGYELNTASTIGALLYGGGDLVETVRLAFNFGWDADNNAATCGAITGVLKGRRWIDSQGWDIRDVYKNTSRDQMPMDETITRFGDRLWAVTKKVILENGGEEISKDGRKVFRIRVQTPANLEPLPQPLDRFEELRSALLPRVEKDLSGSSRDRARAAYLAICLGEAKKLSKDTPKEWQEALAELRKFPGVLRNLFDTPKPSGDKLQAEARAQGLKRPAKEPAGTKKEPADIKPGDAMIDKHLAQETARLSKRFRDGAGTREEWEARRPRLRQEYLDMLGLWPLPPKTPLHLTITGTLERDGVVIEKLHFQSRPKLYVTGDLYRPKTSDRPKASDQRREQASGPESPRAKLPAVLYVCGHSGRGRDGNKTAFQDHGMWFASNGYICLIIDTLQLGEIPGVHHGTYREGRWWWQALGYTPAGVECWNGIRAIDYLLSRPDLDPQRLAVTGISGGGASTFWIAAADERVRCAVPVSGMSDLESYVTHKVINGHCDCMFLVNTYQWEWTTIAALIAPRPLLFCNSDEDPIFPMDGNRRIIARLRQLYKMYDKPELVDEYVSHGGHAYRPDLRIAIFKWINKHFKNDTGPVKDADFEPLPGKDLRVFPEDKDIPKDAINGKIDETFVARAKVKLPEHESFQEWKGELLKELRQRSFRSLPERVPPAKRGKSTEVIEFDLATEPGIEVLAATVREAKDTPRDVALIVLNPDEVGEELKWLRWVRPLVGDAPGVALLPRGVGREWTRKSPPNYVERAQALLGRAVDEGRVWDIAATARFLVAEHKEKPHLKVIGRGQAGILAAYAALFEPSISEVIVIDPPASHREGPIFLNVLRILDVPEALGLLAPKPLTLTNAKDKAFHRTVEIYKRAGAEDKLTRR